MTRAEIMAKIAQIQALIADLQKQLAALSGATPATFSCSQITKTLFYGMTNDPQVKCLQEVLKSQGYTIAVSGNYDAATKTAVAQFQQKYASENPYQKWLDEHRVFLFELPPGESLVYLVRVRTKQAGQFRFRAEASVPGMSQPSNPMSGANAAP